MMPTGVVFLTGATGYVGSRLLPALDGWSVRALTRDAARLECGHVEVVEGDVLDTDLLRNSLKGVSVAYYLVHSLGTSDFGTADRDAARSFAVAAGQAGVGRIVYLGGLGRGELSPHLASRQEVGMILRESGVATLELRASIVIGEGSVSYDALRALAALPVAVMPDWIDNPSQPIAIHDVVAYLLAAAAIRLPASEVFEIGGAEAVSYRTLLQELGARVTAVPAPRAAGAIATLLKPLQPERVRIVSDLIDSLRCDTSVHDDAGHQAFDLRPMGLRAAIASAAS